MCDSIPKISDLTFIILAGGFGTRLNPVLNGHPKVLAKIDNRPFVFFLLDLIRKIGGTNVIVCTGYRADDVETAISKQYAGSLNLTYSRETTPLGTGGALRLCSSQIKSEYALVLNGDSYIKTDLKEYINWCLTKDCEAGLLLTEIEDSSRYGKVSITKDGMITQFMEKESSTGGGLINAGVYFFKKDTLLGISEKTPTSLENDFFPQLTGSILYGYVGSGDFIDIGTPESYKKAECFFKKS